MQYYCVICNKQLTKGHISRAKYKNRIPKCCSTKCKNLNQITKIQLNCLQCNIIFHKTNKEVGKNNFCSKSCAAIYNNAHKTKGTRRSKLEAWLEKQLLILYPTLEFKFNSKTEINSELDIFIPALKLAFELNGIFHYEPIFGREKLSKTQNNDHRKFQACLENNIELCIIDVSKIKYFKESTSKPILDIIINIINNKVK